MKFKNYISHDDILQQVARAIGADVNSPDMLRTPLANYELKDKILTIPGLQDILNKSKNRGAIIQAVQKNDDSITVGDVVNMIHRFRLDVVKPVYKIGV